MSRSIIQHALTANPIWLPSPVHLLRGMIINLGARYPLCIPKNKFVGLLTRVASNMALRQAKSSFASQKASARVQQKEELPAVCRAEKKGD